MLIPLPAPEMGAVLWGTSAGCCGIRGGVSVAPTWSVLRRSCPLLVARPGSHRQHSSPCNWDSGIHRLPEQPRRTHGLRSQWGSHSSVTERQLQAWCFCSWKTMGSWAAWGPSLMLSKQPRQWSWFCAFRVLEAQEGQGPPLLWSPVSQTVLAHRSFLA